MLSVAVDRLDARKWRLLAASLMLACPAKWREPIEPYLHRVRNPGDLDSRELRAIQSEFTDGEDVSLAEHWETRRHRLEVCRPDLADEPGHWSGRRSRDPLMALRHMSSQWAFQSLESGREAAVGAFAALRCIIDTSVLRGLRFGDFLESMHESLEARQAQKAFANAALKAYHRAEEIGDVPGGAASQLERIGADNFVQRLQGELDRGAESRSDRVSRWLHRMLAEKLREQLGNPFRPYSLLATSMTEATIAIARGIEADSAYDRLPILADALEDAGETNAALLRHCRGEAVHEPGCWAIDILLRRESAMCRAPKAESQPPSRGASRRMGRFTAAPEGMA